MNLNEIYKDLLSQATNSVARITRYGSYAQRHPNLGRLRTCPYCGTRRYENQVKDDPCCHAKFSVENAPGAGLLRALAAGRKIRKHPRLSRNRPPMFLMHDLLLQIERGTLEPWGLQVEVEGLPPFHEPTMETPVEQHATLVERVIVKRKKLQAKKYRDQQKLSRRINRSA